MTWASCETARYARRHLKYHGSHTFGTFNSNKHCWCNGIIQDSHSWDPGSIPGQCNFCKSASVSILVFIAVEKLSINSRVVPSQTNIQQKRQLQNISFNIVNWYMQGIMFTAFHRSLTIPTSSFIVNIILHGKTKTSKFCNKICPSTQYYMYMNLLQLSGHWLNNLHFDKCIFLRSNSLS